MVNVIYYVKYDILFFEYCYFRFINMRDCKILLMIYFLLVDIIIFIFL